MYPFTALVYVKHARTYHQTLRPESAQPVQGDPQVSTGRGIQVEAEVLGSLRSQPGLSAQ